LDRLIWVTLVFVLLLTGAFAYNHYLGQATKVQQGVTNHIVPADQIVSGGPPPDGIPSIDNPKFVTAADSSTFLAHSFDDTFDWVIGISYKGDVRAYPLQILAWHEIVNDVVAGTPIAITYCPLCFSAAAYVRVVNGTPIQFGTSGKLYNNNLVMYDRLTKSLWSQIWGEAIQGKLQGTRLTRVPVDVLTWEDWEKLYPNTLVLSPQTGFNRPYSKDPYADYYNTDQILFPLSHQDTRLPPKTLIYGLVAGDESRAYPVDNIARPVTMDSFSGKTFLVWKVGFDVRFFDSSVDGVVLHFKAGNGTAIDLETLSTWNIDGVAISGPLAGTRLMRYTPEPAFWFAWASFYHDTQIYTPRP
jgi:hypothetical protein